MDPTIWGPGLWRIIEDVARKSDRIPSQRTDPIWRYTIQFFEALTFLLPCKYCRQSYETFIIQSDVSRYVRARRAVEWIWLLKEMVNDKLKKPADVRLSFDKFLRRVNMCTQCGSAEDVLDFLALLGHNYHSTDSPVKIKYMLILHAVLPAVLSYPALQSSLEKYPLQLKNLQTQAEYLKWLYTLRQHFNKVNKLPPLPPQEILWKRYHNAKAGAVPIQCPVVLNDPSTWSPEYAAQCGSTT